MSFLNRRGQSIVGCLYVQSTFADTAQRVCLLYLHGNIGSQREGRFLVDRLLPLGISLFCFDFTGSGLSDGEYVGLGHHEHEDAIDVVNLLRSQLNFSGFVLWGRSMGAATALMAAPRSPLIRGFRVCVAQRTFSGDCREGADSRNSATARCLVGQARGSRAHFECDQVNPAVIGRGARVLLLIGHPQDDDFLPISHADTIVKEWEGRRRKW
jgi:dipeptidyl aminopeptidase/acylaminoacyl peptidase